MKRSTTIALAAIAATAGSVGTFRSLYPNDCRAQSEPVQQGLSYVQAESYKQGCGHSSSSGTHLRNSYRKSSSASSSGVDSIWRGGFGHSGLSFFHGGG